MSDGILKSLPVDDEAAVLEYILGLDGLGLGGKAQRIYGRCMARDVRPCLLRQRQAGKLWDKKLISGERLDEVLRAEAANIKAAWVRCLEQLKTLWLTEGNGVELTDEEAA